MFKASLQKRGFNGKLLAHMILWHPNPASRMNAYQSNNEYTIGKQLDVLEAFGFDGVVVTWQGVGVAFQHSAAMEFSKQTSDRSMLFALLLDPAVVAQRLAGATIEQALAAQLNHPDTQLMLNRPSYAPGKPVFDFDTEANFDVMAKQFPQLQFWKRHIQYSWPETVYTDASGQQQQLTPAQVVAQLKTDNANPAMKAPGIFSRFFDGGLLDAKGVPDFSKGAWPVAPGKTAKPARIIHSLAGNTFHNSVDAIPNLSSIPYLCFVTWNDYTEGSEGEAFFSMVSGIRIS